MIHTTVLFGKGFRRDLALAFKDADDLDLAVRFPNSLKCRFVRRGRLCLQLGLIRGIVIGRYRVDL